MCCEQALSFAGSGASRGPSTPTESLVVLCTFPHVLQAVCDLPKKRSRGSIKFRSLRPKGPIAGVEFLGKAHQQRGWGRCTSLSGVRGGAPAAQRFSCTLRSPDSLLCCIIRGKQLQKSLNGSKVVAATPLGQKLHEQGGYQL